MQIFVHLLSERRKVTGVAVLFILVWATVLFFATDCFILGTDCTGNGHRGLDPILGYLSTGELRLSSNPDAIYTSHPVGYSVFLFAIGAYEGMRPFLPAIIIHGAFLFITGLIVFSITLDNWSRAAIIALALTIFNPNLVFVFSQPRGDGLFVLLVTSAMFAAFSYINRPTWTAVIACGIALGVATNIRPATYYLIFAIPVLTICIEYFADRANNYVAAFVKGCAGTAVGFLLIFPWLYHVNSTGEGYSISDNELKLAWMSDFRAMLEDTKVRSLTANEAIFGAYDDTSRKSLLLTFGPERAKLLANNVAGWSELSSRERYKLRYDDMLEQLKGYSTQTYLIAVLPNLKYFLLSGGEGELFKSFGIFQDLPRWKLENPILYMIVKFIFIGYSLALKLFAFLGIWYLARQRRYEIMAMFLGVILYFVVVHTYHGSPRYRAPIEPILAISAALGMLNMKYLIKGALTRPR